MPKVGNIPSTAPYLSLGTYGGLPFWPGGLTLLAAAPGVGKTSCLAQIVHQAAASNLPAALGCYEHTSDELKFRLQLQAEASVAGPHVPADPEIAAAELAKSSEAALLALSDRVDTLRAVEEILIEDYDFPAHGPALLAMDYLQRIPSVGLTGMTPEERQAGEAAAGLRELARRRGWAVIAAAALKAESFEGTARLSSLLGDERVSYEADRVLLMERSGEVRDCGCVSLVVHTLKNRVGPATSFRMEFWGARFYPALNGEAGHE